MSAVVDLNCQLLGRWPSSGSIIAAGTAMGRPPAGAAEDEHLNVLDGCRVRVCGDGVVHGGWRGRAAGRGGAAPSPRLLANVCCANFGVSAIHLWSFWDILAIVSFRNETEEGYFIAQKVCGVDLRARHII